MADTCQHQGCNKSADDFVYWSSEAIDNAEAKAIRMFFCDEHEEDVRRYLKNHEHYFLIEKDDY